MGQKSLGSEYVNNKVKCWVKDVEELADIAREEPQLAYACYTKGLSHRWTYVMRTIPDIQHLLVPLEAAIANILIPAIIGRAISDTEREIMELPVRYGGMGMPSPVKIAAREHASSKAITEPLVNLILKQELTLENFDRKAVETTKQLLKVEKEKEHKQRFSEVSAMVSSQTKRAMTLAREKGASSWLTTLPLRSLSYTLNKQEFRDSVALRYSWPIQDIPVVCACGAKNNILHTLDCKLGGFVSMRHDSLRDRTAGYRKDAGCKDIRVEPQLLPVDPRLFESRTNTQPGARLDVSARGVWSRFERSFCDI